MGDREMIIFIIFVPQNNARRDGRVVECGGLENRCSPSGEPGVRIPLSPPSLAIAPFIGAKARF